MADSPPPDPSRRPFDPAKWEPEQGDPFQGNAYDRVAGAVDETLRDEADSRPGSWGTPLGFVVDLVWNLIFPRRR